MSMLERRLLFLGVALAFLAFTLWVTGGGRFSLPAAEAQQQSQQGCIDVPGVGCAALQYYGADLSAGGGMEKSTGVSLANRFNRPNNAPWPQYAGNYCFLAVVQALTNYEDWKSNHSAPVHYPHQSNQGPPSPNTPWFNGDPSKEVSGQILTDMDTQMKPTFGTITPTGSGQNRRPFTLANSSYDFGGDPRAQAYASWYETPNNHFYHQYIYHNGVDGASYGLAKGVAASHADGNSPEIAIINHATHSVVVAGVFANGNPAQISNAVINSFAVYNPWDQSWGSYINGAYYEQVSYTNWTQGVSHLNGPFGPGSDYWWKLSYSSNNGIDPDPVIGIYQAGPGTSNPNAHHWINYYVSIQRDEDSKDNANYCINETGQVMTGP